MLQVCVIDLSAWSLLHMRSVRKWQMCYTFILSFLLLLLLDAVPTQLIEMKQSYATQWVAGDLVIKQPNIQQIPELLANERVSESIKMGTMALYQDEAYLVHLQSIDDNYPLYGELLGPEGSIPKDGVWVSQDFAEIHNMQITDQIAIGNSVFFIAGFVIRQDEQIFDFEAFSPSVFMRLDQVMDIGLVSDTSRLNHYIYTATDTPKILAESLNEVLRADARVIQPEESLGRIDRVLVQVIDFLWIARLLGYLMAGFLMHLAFEYYLHDLAYNVGIYMVMGANSIKRLRYILVPIISQAFYAIIFSGLIVLPILYGIDYVLTTLPVQISFSYMDLIIRSLSVFSAILFLLASLHTVSLVRIPVLKLLRSHPRSINYPILFLVSVAIAVYSIMLDWDIVQVLVKILSIASLLMVFYLMIVAIIKILMRYLAQGGVRALLLLNGLRLYVYEYAFVILFTTCILTLMTFVWHVQSQAIPAWQATVPQGAANAFMVGIQSDEIAPLKSQFPWLNDTFYPIVKGRLTQINEEPNIIYKGGEFINHEVFNRQINLTMLDEIPSNNTLIEGSWNKEGISAEKGIMQRLGLSMGDELTFLIYDDVITLPITSIREVDWQSMRANFYFIFPKDVLLKYSASYITNAFLPEENKQDIVVLQQSFPGITFLDVALFIEAAQSLLSQVIYLVSAILAIISMFGIAAFLQMLFRQAQQKQQQSVVMRRLGLDPKKYPVIRDELYCIMIIATLLTLSIGSIIISVINSLIAATWYYDIYSVIVIGALWVIMLLYIKLSQSTYDVS